MSSNATFFDRVLVVVAHPDDEILGCGASMKQWRDDGCNVRTVILGEGKTSRDTVRDRAKRQTEIDELRAEILTANRLVDVEDAHVLDFPDNRFDSVPLLDIVKAVESHIETFRPTAVFTHFADDMNVDHTITNRAVLTATRPLPGNGVGLVGACEVLSSSGWYYPHSFAPNFFISVGEACVQAKVDAMAAYRSELREFPHPRSLEAIRDLARVRGASIGAEYAEGFHILRMITA